MTSLYESATQRAGKMHQNPTDKAMEGAPLRVGTALLAAMLLVMVPQFSSASTAECKNEWRQSDASDTCKSTDIEFVQGSDPEECDITASCTWQYTMHIEGEEVVLNATASAETEVELSEVSDLEMCISGKFEGNPGTVSLSTSCN